MRVVAMETAKAAGARRSATGLAASVLRAVAAAILAGAVLWICSGIVAPSSAWADDAGQAVQDAEVEISADGDAARMEGCDFAVEGFECSRTGSARDIDGLSYGYTYRLSGTDRVAVVNTADYAVLFIPRTVADEFGIEDEGSSQVQEIKTYLAALDENFSTGVNPLASQEEWKVLIADAEGAEGASLAVGDATFTFGREISEDRFYVTVEGPDDAFDVKSEVRPAQMDSGRLVPAEGAVIAQKGGPLEQLGEFLATMDYSPLWVTLKTTAARPSCSCSSWGFWPLHTSALRIPDAGAGHRRLHLHHPHGAAADGVRLPAAARRSGKQHGGGAVVLPGDRVPARCSAGRPRCMAAVVVAFPLMYRSARGAFESLDPNMLDAARTLGWCNAALFFMRLMLPLGVVVHRGGHGARRSRGPWASSGATLFLAGNHLGSTRTIPIAIYFEWMNGNTEATWFWTIVLLVFSFLVILFINLWSRRTTQLPPGDGSMIRSFWRGGSATSSRSDSPRCAAERAWWMPPSRRVARLTLHQRRAGFVSWKEGFCLRELMAIPSGAQRSRRIPCGERGWP